MPLTGSRPLIEAELNLGRMFPEAYKRVLGARGVAAPLAGTTIGRLAIAAQPLSTILLIKGSTGSFAAAGLVEACYSLAAAGSLPVQGRVIDRIGQTRVVVIVTLVNALAFAALIPLSNGGAPLIWMALAGTVAGLATPPLGASMRSLWAGLVPDQDLRQAAFAIDAVAVDAAFILGPSIAAAVIAIASPAASLAVCIGLTLIGSAVFAASAASRTWRGSPAEHGRIGPLRSAGIWVLMGAAFGVGTAVGAAEIAITAFASEHGAAELGGTLVAIQAFGSVLGGLWFGARRWRLPPEQRLPAVSIAFALTLAPLVAVPSMAAAFPLMALSGVALAPAISVIYLLLDSLAPQGTAVEATGWVLMAIVSGAALGNGLAGLAVSEASPHAGLAIALGGGLITAGTAVIGRQALRAATDRAIPEFEPAR